MKINPLDLLEFVEHATPSSELTAVFITYNEAHCIVRAIESVKHQVNEVVVLDADSTDDTLALCKAAGAFCYRTVWRNDFSLLRNEALSLIKTKWCLFLDADQWVPSQNDWKTLRGKLAAVEQKLPGTSFEEDNHARFFLPIHSMVEAQSEEALNFPHSMRDRMMVHYEERLFFSRTKYYRPVVERPLSPEFLKAIGETEFESSLAYTGSANHLRPEDASILDFPIFHDGYTIAALEKKGERKLMVFDRWAPYISSVWFKQAYLEECLRVRKKEKFLKLCISMSVLLGDAEENRRTLEIIIDGLITFDAPKALAKFIEGIEVAEFIDMLGVSKSQVFEEVLFLGVSWLKHSLTKADFKTVSAKVIRLYAMTRERVLASRKSIADRASWIIEKGDSMYESRPFEEPKNLIDKAFGRYPFAAGHTSHPGQERILPKAPNGEFKLIVTSDQFKSTIGKTPSFDMSSTDKALALVGISKTTKQMGTVIKVNTYKEDDVKKLFA